MAAFVIRRAYQEAGTGLLYVEVDFYASEAARVNGERPFCREDFRMQIAPDSLEPSAIDASGNPIAWARRVRADRELRAEVIDNIERHVKRLNGSPKLRGDRRMRTRPEAGAGRVADAVAPLVVRP